MGMYIYSDITKVVYCCATCANLVFYECAYPHWECKSNSECPCNGSEIPDYEFCCKEYIME